MPLSRGRAWHRADLIAIIDSFDAMWNAHDLDAVLEIFTEDATVVIEHREADRPRVFTGIVEIREMLKLWLPAYTVRSRSHYIDGDRVIWMAVGSTDHRSSYVEEITAKCEATVRGDKIVVLNISIPAEHESRMECRSRQGAPVRGFISDDLAEIRGASFW